MLTVTGKSGKVRLVPLHPSTTAMLGDYAVRRDRLCPGARCPEFFINTAGNRVRVKDADVTFARLLALAGVHAPPGRRRPRIHDIRHYADGWVMRPAVTFPLAGAAELVLQSA